MKINIHLDDSLKAMESMPDKKYDLALVDPPYGINHANKAGKMAGQKYGNAAAKKRDYKSKDWDSAIPTKEYFKELQRVSKNVIIWGGNYFSHLLKSKSGWIFWDKNNGDNNFSDGELAYTSFDCGLRKVTITWNGMIQYDMKNKTIRIHPTEKPVALYKWLLKNYGFNKDGSKRTIFDSHGGSLSIVIACIDMGFDIDIWEIDPDYYRDGVNRVKRHLDQLDLTREMVEINYI